MHASASAWNFFKLTELRASVAMFFAALLKSSTRFPESVSSSASCSSMMASKSSVCTKAVKASLRASISSPACARMSLAASVLALIAASLRSSFCP